MRPHRRLIHRAIISMIAAGAVLTVAAPASAAGAASAGYASDLTRAPYLTDLTASSVRVSWATTTQSRGIVRFGTGTNCAATQVSSATLGSPITVGGARQYANSVEVTGLAAGTAYCYRTYTGAGVDLLGAAPTPHFATLDAATSTAPLTFDVFGDWGDTNNHGVNTGALNVNQANLMAQMAGSGARFVVSTGDIGYQGGTQTNYGDLRQTGVDVSAVFGPSYWAAPGQVLPMYTVTANHGKNANFINIWPQSTTAAASGGVYGMTSYPSIDGSAPGTYPSMWSAFSTGGTRFYLLEAAWGNSNVGSATGGACGSHCAMYQVDADAHWKPSSAEYKWLAADLAAHPGGVKMAFFHFPLRSDDSSQPTDAYLSGVESLFAGNGVNLVFNGHSHTYQRHMPGAGHVVSYVTGGGGARLTSLGHCSATDAYGVGWSYTGSKATRCGAAPATVGEAQVYHFLKVTVSGSTVTVVPTDSTGRTFDVQSYTF